MIGSSRAAFEAAITRENHTLKRALTDPRLLSGIGNAYSDEILHRAQLSPIAMTRKLGPDEVERLYDGDLERPQRRPRGPHPAGARASP